MVREVIVVGDDVGEDMLLLVADLVVELVVVVNLCVVNDVAEVDATVLVWTVDDLVVVVVTAFDFVVVAAFDFVVVITGGSVCITYPLPFK